jgi:hypothetical protein
LQVSDWLHSLPGVRLVTFTPGCQIGCTHSRVSDWLHSLPGVRLAALTPGCQIDYTLRGCQIGYMTVRYVCLTRCIRVVSRIASAGCFSLFGSVINRCSDCKVTWGKVPTLVCNILAVIDWCSDCAITRCKVPPLVAGVPTGRAGGEAGGAGDGIAADQRQHREAAPQPLRARRAAAGARGGAVQVESS